MTASRETEPTSRATDKLKTADSRESSSKAMAKPKATSASNAMAAYLRAENEDDDGYDPYSDRPASPEPLFERDPWS